MNITCVTNFADLPAAAEWNRLAGDSPFRSWEWLGSWWEAFGSDFELMTVLVHDENEKLVAIAPWYIHHSKTRGRVIRFLGDGKVCSDYSGVLVGSEDAEGVLAFLGSWIAASGVGKNGAGRKWNVLDLDGIAKHDQVIPLLLNKIGVHERVVETVSEHTWKVSLPATWDGYLADRNKRRRNMLRKITKNCIANGRAEIRFAETAEESREFLASLIRLHTLRRQELGCDGCFADDRFTRFLKLAAERLQNSGKLWMTKMTIDGEVAANTLAIREGKTVYLYQCGFDPKFTELRPGWIQNIFILQRAIAEGVDFVDFLRGDEPYKSQLGGEPTALLRMRVAAPTLVAQVRNSIALAVGGVFHAIPR